MDVNNAHAMAMSAHTPQLPPLSHPHYHHNYQYHHIQYQPNSLTTPLPPPQPSYPPSSSQEGINTIFISGLPSDVKAREIYNLFRRRPGFDFCHLEYTGRGNQVIAFATFLDHQSAVATMNTLNGVTFDPQIGSSLHIELARSNSRSKRSRGDEAYFIVDKRNKALTDDQEIGDAGDDESDEPLGTNNPNSSQKDNLATTQSADTTADPGDVGVVAKEQPEKNVTGELPPCSTLFIANLGPACTEEELRQALSQCSGFHMVKMRANRGMPVAFADFEDVHSATKALQNLQDSVLPSSDRGGMHLEYARSKMKPKRV